MNMRSIKYIIIALVLAVLLMGCESKKNEINPDNTSEKENNASITEASSESKEHFHTTQDDEEKETIPTEGQLNETQPDATMGEGNSESFDEEPVIEPEETTEDTKPENEEIEDPTEESYNPDNWPNVLPDEEI